MKIKNKYEFSLSCGTIIIGGSMDILSINRRTLAGLAEAYPDSFQGLDLVGNNLLYNAEAVDISNFNVNDLLTEENDFASNLGSLMPSDVFRIIRLHAVMLQSKNQANKIDKTEIIKKENPLLKNISIVTRTNEYGSEELINIVDSKGNDHLFVNDRNLDLLNLCELIRVRKGSDVFPEELIAIMHDKLPEVTLEKAEKLAEKPTTTEDFANKMRNVNEPYKDEKTMKVYGNQEHDVALVVDSNDLSNHEIVTFRKNEFGDFEQERHKQNVSGVDTSVSTADSNEFSTDEEVSKNTSTDAVIKDDKQKEISAILITSDEFYRLLNNPNELTEEEKRNVDLFYGYLGDLVLYEDYLVPELKAMLNQFRAYVYEVQYNNNGIEINSKQQQAVDKSVEFEEKKMAIENERSFDKVEKEIRILRKRYPDANVQAGFAATMQVVAFIIGAAIVLTAITLYLLS